MADTIYTANPIKTLYYLLYAKYANSSIASSDPNQFKYKVFATIFEYGPAWLSRLKVQEKLFNVDINAEDPEYLKGSITFNNHAQNPDTEPTTDSFDALEGINAQTTRSVKRGVLEGLEVLSDLIKTDVTEEFLGKFKKLFITVVAPQAPLWYQSIGNSEELVDDALMCDNSLYGNYRTNTFQEIWETADDFIADYEDCGIPPTI